MTAAQVTTLDGRVMIDARVAGGDLDPDQQAPLLRP